jgi:hypothetical protein
VGSAAGAVVAVGSAAGAVVAVGSAAGAVVAVGSAAGTVVAVGSAAGTVVAVARRTAVGVPSSPQAAAISPRVITNPKIIQTRLVLNILHPPSINFSVHLQGTGRTQH